MHITIAAVGKVREPYLKEGIELYRSRIALCHKILLIDLQEERIPEHCPPRERSRIVDAEWTRFLSSVTRSGIIIALDQNGENLSSEALASRMKQYELEGKGSITFLIGGPLGLPADVLKKANWVLSLSRMTFPHQLVRLILLEQIYRADCINRNIPYHK
ncbi:MAG: 23S rRNA (pseudouridine(1915)-N(3))-methyltransferase RlmH [Methanoregulaceae archaeon]|nr:23S rRNA (pseudouridine(1915)-N(3))-methyltransferase RlmH [Methanoregulaceae archaeon]